MNDWICPIWICLQGQLSKFLLALLACFFVQQKAPPVKYFLLPLALACLSKASAAARPVHVLCFPVLPAVEGISHFPQNAPRKAKKKRKEKKRKEKKSKTPL